MRLLFICHGNICRSVMAEMIFKHLNTNSAITCDSMAVSDEEIGKKIYPNAKRILEAHKIPIVSHYAKQFKASDYDLYDVIYYMDVSNLNRLARIHKDDKNKYKQLGINEISDPWYTRDFEKCYQEISSGIRQILN